MLFELDNPILDTYRTLFHTKVTEYNAAVGARNAAKSGGKAPKWKSLLTTPMPVEDSLNLTEQLSAIVESFDIDQSNAHVAAHIASALYKLADHFADQASLWATDLPSDHGEIKSDEEIKALAEACDLWFSKFMDEVIPLNASRTSPDIESMIIEVTGMPVLVRKMTDGSCRYSLDIERIRIKKSVDADAKLTLTVNGTPMAGKNFAQEVDTAFSLKPLTFLDLAKESPDYNVEGKPFTFIHNDLPYSIQLTTVKPS